MSYLTRLSGPQRLWLAATLIAMFAIVGVGWILEPKGDQVAASSFTNFLTIRQLVSVSPFSRHRFWMSNIAESGKASVLSILMTLSQPLSP